jgi:predicted  nucleic acid-binding Zn-ribbon protein
MDEAENEKLNEIHNAVQETQTQIRVIHERTGNMDARLQNVKEEAEKNSNDIDKLESSVNRNTTAVAGITSAVTASAVWIGDKLLKLF